MDANRQSPTASSFAMASTSLSDLMASVHGDPLGVGGGSSPHTRRTAARSFLSDFARQQRRSRAEEFRRGTPPPRSRLAAASVASSTVAGVVAGVAAAGNPFAASDSLLSFRADSPRRRSRRLASVRSYTDAPEEGDALLNATPKSPPTERASRKRKSSSTKNPPARAQSMRKKPPPHVKVTDENDDRKPAAVANTEEVSCCICMGEPSKEEVSVINGCDHLFCFECICKWSEHENSCPLCKKRFTAVNRVHKFKRRKAGIHNSMKVKPRDQRSDLITGPAIEAMLASIAASDGANTRFGRFFLALGGQPSRAVQQAGAFSARGRANRANRTTLVLEDGGLYPGMAEEDDDDDDMPNLNFNHLMRRAGPPGGFAHGMPPGSLFDFGMSQHRASMLAARMPHSASRTYASNSQEQNAGTVANPLEIDLDDDDDEVEVISNPSV